MGRVGPIEPKPSDDRETNGCKARRQRRLVVRSGDASREVQHKTFPQVRTEREHVPHQRALRVKLDRDPNPHVERLELHCVFHRAQGDLVVRRTSALADVTVHWGLLAPQHEGQHRLGGSMRRHQLGARVVVDAPSAPVWKGDRGVKALRKKMRRGRVCKRRRKRPRRRTKRNVRRGRRRRRTTDQKQRKEPRAMQGWSAYTHRNQTASPFPGKRHASGGACRFLSKGSYAVAIEASLTVLRRLPWLGSFLFSSLSALWCS